MRARIREASQERLDQSGLADTWLTGDTDHAGPAVSRRVECLAQCTELGFTPDHSALGDDSVGSVTARRLKREDAVEYVVHVVRCRPLIRVLREHPHDERVEYRRNAAVQSRRRHRVPENDRTQDRHVGARVERVPARRKLVQHDAQREDVARWSHELAGRLLRRHVTHRSDDDTRLRDACIRIARRRGLLRKLRDPEVENLHVSVVAQHEILGLDVPMNDARLMGYGERAGGLRPDPGDGRDGWRFGPELAKSSALDELHGDEMPCRRFTDLVDRDDVGMVQRRRRAGFAAKALHRIGVKYAMAREELHDELPLELRVPRAV